MEKKSKNIIITVFIIWFVLFAASQVINQILIKKRIEKDIKATEYEFYKKQHDLVIKQIHKDLKENSLIVEGINERIIVLKQKDYNKLDSLLKVYNDYKTNHIIITDTTYTRK